MPGSPHPPPGRRPRTVPCGEGGRSWREFDRSFEGNQWRRVCLRAAVHALTPRVAPLARSSPREGRRQPSARSAAPPAFARCHAARADALGGSSTGASRATNGAGCASVQLCMCIALETSSHLRNNNNGRMTQCAAVDTSRRLSAMSGLLASACACAARKWCGKNSTHSHHIVTPIIALETSSHLRNNNNGRMTQ